MDKRITVVLMALGIGGILFLFMQQRKLPTTMLPTPIPVSMPTTQEEPVDYKARFAIFTNGTFRVFTAAMYHNLSNDVFIQATNPNIVQVKKSGLTWNDFFATLPFSLTKECLTTGTGEKFCSGSGGTLKFYLNGVKTENLLDLEIHEDDQVLITFGSESETEIQKQLQRIPDIQ